MTRGCLLYSSISSENGRSPPAWMNNSWNSSSSDCSSLTSAGAAAIRFAFASVCSSDVPHGQATAAAPCPISAAATPVHRSPFAALKSCRTIHGPGVNFSDMESPKKKPTEAGEPLRMAGGEGKGWWWPEVIPACGVALIPRLAGSKGAQDLKSCSVYHLCDGTAHCCGRHSSCCPSPLGIHHQDCKLLRLRSARSTGINQTCDSSSAEGFSPGLG